MKVAAMSPDNLAYSPSSAENELSAGTPGGAGEPSGVPENKPRILVVDDVADNRDVLSRRLVRRGFEVAEASGGRQALEKLSGESFDLVLLDIMMPDLSGNEVLRQLRKTRSDVELPVIMVSAKSQSDDVVESLTLGANDYVIKPIDFSVALARINTQLARKRAADTELAARRDLEVETARLHEGSSTIPISCTSSPITTRSLACSTGPRSATCSTRRSTISMSATRSPRSSSSISTTSRASTTRTVTNSAIACSRR